MVNQFFEKGTNLPSQKPTNWVEDKSAVNKYWQELAQKNQDKLRNLHTKENTVKNAVDTANNIEGREIKAGDRISAILKDELGLKDRVLLLALTHLTLSGKAPIDVIKVGQKLSIIKRDDNLYLSIKNAGGSEYIKPTALFPEEDRFGFSDATQESGAEEQTPVTQETPKPTTQPMEVAPTEQPAPQPLDVAPTEQPTTQPMEVAPTEQPAPQPLDVAPTEQPTTQPLEVAPTEQPAPQPLDVAPTEEPGLLDRAKEGLNNQKELISDFWGDQADNLKEKVSSAEEKARGLANEPAPQPLDVAPTEEPGLLDRAKEGLNNQKELISDFLKEKVFSAEEKAKASANEDVKDKALSEEQSSTQESSPTNPELVQEDPKSGAWDFLKAKAQEAKNAVQDRISGQTNENVVQDSTTPEVVPVKPFNEMNDAEKTAWAETTLPGIKEGKVEITELTQEQIDYLKEYNKTQSQQQ